MRGWSAECCSSVSIRWLPHLAEKLTSYERVGAPCTNRGSSARLAPDFRDGVRAPAPNSARPATIELVASTCPGAERGRTRWRRRLSMTQSSIIIMKTIGAAVLLAVSLSACSLFPPSASVRRRGRDLRPDAAVWGGRTRPRLVSVNVERGCIDFRCVSQARR